MNTKKILMSFMVLLTMSFAFVACSDDDKNTPTAPVSMALEMPINLKVDSLKNAVATFTNVQTGGVYTLTGFITSDGTYTATLSNIPVGTYNVAVTGKVFYAIGGTASSIDVTAVQNGVVVAEGTTPSSVKLVLTPYNAKAGFVISEMYFTGSATPEGKAYLRDQYVVITNNTDHTLYADSLAFVGSAFNNSQKYDYTPDIMSQAISVSDIYMIPGNGKDVPVEAGKSLLLALDARNHTFTASTAYDLSHANFEFYDESTNASKDNDNTEVPNLDRWYAETLSFFTFHSRGLQSYALVKLQGSKEDFLKNNFYEAKYLFSFNGLNKEMVKKAYKIPNEWVVDAVNLGVEGTTVWNVFSASLDMSRTYTLNNFTDKTGYNKSVIRKMVNGKYQDTNDSATDFIARSTPSLAK
ncbi:MAG: DUF4876 domain-containing protein [Prevotellaceae bacterium]|nr:DUF4876 domain-containing protein [Prevotellaceae bacterium]MDY3364883.1 DUF4876 domain-containing protein [Prevotella sp.]